MSKTSGGDSFFFINRVLALEPKYNECKEKKTEKESNRMNSIINTYKTTPLKDIIRKIDDTPDAVILYVEDNLNNEPRNYNHGKVSEQMRTGVLFGNEIAIRVHKTAKNANTIRIDTLLCNGNTTTDLYPYRDAVTPHPIIRCVEHDFGIKLTK